MVQWRVDIWRRCGEREKTDREHAARRGRDRQRYTQLAILKLWSFVKTFQFSNITDGRPHCIQDGAQDGAQDGRMRWYGAHPKRSHPQESRDEYIELPAPHARHVHAHIMMGVRIEMDQSIEATGGSQRSESERTREGGGEEEGGGEGPGGARVLEDRGPFGAVHIVLVAALVTLCVSRAQKIHTRCWRRQIRVRRWWRHAATWAYAGHCTRTDRKGGASAAGRRAR